jgi:hypothetical protein
LLTSAQLASPLIAHDDEFDPLDEQAAARRILPLLIAAAPLASERSGMHSGMFPGG